MSKAGATRQTQGMPARPDHTGVIAALAGLIDTINAGAPGLEALSRLLSVTQDGLGAAGMSFVEYGPTGGRVIAATGTMAWALGRPVDLNEVAKTKLSTGPRTMEVPAERFPEPFCSELAGCGLARALYCRAELGSLVVGHVQAFYRQADPVVTPDHHALIQLAAACGAHQYADSAGLPVHGDGPVVAALTDGLAIVDQDGRIRLWNPAAERMTGFRAAEVLGRSPTRCSTTTCRTAAG
jgi:two-component system phosphate regulon sensor histidine kinase PhoR